MPRWLADCASPFSPLEVNFHFYANYVSKFSFVLSTNIAAMQTTYYEGTFFCPEVSTDVLPRSRLAVPLFLFIQTLGNCYVQLWYYSDSQKPSRDFTPSWPHSVTCSWGHENLYYWYQSENLMLNDERTEFIIIGTHQQLAKVNTHGVCVGHCGLVSLMKNSPWLHM